MATKPSALSGLLDQCFGTKATDAAQILNSLESRAPVPPAPLAALVTGTQSLTEPAAAAPITIRPSEPQTVKQSDSQTVQPSHSQTLGRSDGQSLTLSEPQTVGASDRQPDYQAGVGFIPLEVRTLPYNQAAVLEQLIRNQVGMTNYKELAQLCGMSPASARDALSRLVSKGFAPPPVTVRSGTFQGFSYVLNKTLCDYFVEAGGLAGKSPGSYQANPQTLRPSDTLTVAPSDRLTIHSSSCFSKEATTTETAQTLGLSDPQTGGLSDRLSLRPSDPFILTGAVGAYWSEEGLLEAQAQKWCEQFEVEAGVMRQQLEWARYDLENNGRRSEVKKDTISWFFGHLRQTGGCFPRPSNYRSPLELRAEAIRLQQEAEAQAQAQLAAADFDRQFMELLADPESEAYQLLASQLSEFARVQMKSGSRRAADMELKELYRAHLGLTGE